MGKPAYLAILRVVFRVTAYLIDNCVRPITVCRPGERTPTFYVNTIQEAFKVIDLDIALTEEAAPINQKGDSQND